MKRITGETGPTIAIHVIPHGESHGCTYCDPGEEYEWHTDAHKDSTIIVDYCEHGYSNPHTIHEGCCSDGWIYTDCEHGFSGEHYYCEHNYDGVEHTYTE